MGFFSDTLARLREELTAQLEKEPDGSIFIRAALGVVDVLEPKRETIEKIGASRLQELLNLGMGDFSVEDRATAVKAMTAAEVIADMESGTADVRKATEDQQAAEAELLAVLKELGEFGCRFAMSFLF